jgi:excinuclease ABC subunit A
MGPDSGTHGGSVVFTGPPGDLIGSATHTGAWLAGRRPLPVSRMRGEPEEWIELTGASANNLKSVDLRIPRGRLVGVCGVSGSGKSSLIIDTLARIVVPIKYTTSVAYEPVDPGPYQELTGAPGSAIVIDQSRSGIGSPGAYLGLEDEIAKIYADESSGMVERIDPKELRRGCTECGGSGQIRHEMGFLPDLYDTCDLCGGTGYAPSVGALTSRGIPLREVAGLSLERVMELFGDAERIRSRLQPALDLGLGYLAFHQPQVSLSGGEVQRLKIAGSLKRKPAALYILDEPTVGQHLEDIGRLVDTLQQIVETGATVLVVEHQPHLLVSCDWLVELGPGAGPDGGEVIAQGSPAQLAEGATPIARHLGMVLRER